MQCLCDPAFLTRARYTSWRKASVELKGRCAVITSYIPQASDIPNEHTGHSTKQKAFDNFHRQHLTELLRQTLPKWCETLNVDLPGIRIQRMRTKWGSCNPKNGRIMLNLELAKKPLRRV